MTRANIFDIKRFGVNDGGGIRTVLFIKGCPMRCKWCHNPEGISPDIHVWSAAGQCVGCENCIEVCSRGALCADRQGIQVNTHLCDLCGDCIRVCPTGAMKADAVSMSADEAVAEILRDEVFFGCDGGVTLSGGECTASPEFSLEILKACKKRGIHTAIETSMYAPEEVMREFADNADSIIADIKILDADRHKASTGVDNSLILRNFEWLAHSGKDLLVRIPLIPGYTADTENIADIAAYIAGINKQIPVELINFNPMCTCKYESLRKGFISNAPLSPYSQNEVQQFAQIIQDQGLSVKY
jgi:glycyl-radical enzyme activating protein